MSMFDTAQPVNEAPKKKKAKDKPRFVVSCFENHARIKTAIDALKGLLEGFEGEVKEHGFNIFVKLGEKTGLRPVNFVGTDGKAEGSVELRSRSSASVLTDEECAVLKAADVPFENRVIVNKLFGINPKYAGDSTMLSQVEAALKAIPGFPIEDFIVVQNERSANVVTEKTIDKAFQNLNKAAEKAEMTKAPADVMAVKAAQDIVKMITVMATKPTTTEDLADVMKNVTTMLLPKTEDESK